jgi:NitT/TauT family transport system substrate-binding protein
MVVVTREPSEDFAWSSLKGMIVLAPGAGGTAPYEFTAGLMREAGCDPAETIFVRDLSTDMLVELFRNGAGDAIVADPFTATTLAVAGVGHFACHLADVGGVMPNSVYYVRRDRLDELHEALIALLHGVSDAMTAITDGAPIAEVIAAEWPNGPHAILEASAARLVTNGTWSGVGIDEAACDRWAGMLHERGLAGAVTFADVVDTRALAAIGRDEP